MKKLSKQEIEFADMVLRSHRNEAKLPIILFIAGLVLVTTVIWLNK